jgi:hypothetical protein
MHLRRGKIIHISADNPRKRKWRRRGVAAVTFRATVSRLLPSLRVLWVDIVRV